VFGGGFIHHGSTIYMYIYEYKVTRVALYTGTIRILVTKVALYTNTNTNTRGRSVLQMSTNIAGDYHPR
jgi:hypothetical protein